MTLKRRTGRSGGRRGKQQQTPTSRVPHPVDDVPPPKPAEEAEPKPADEEEVVEKADEEKSGEDNDAAAAAPDAKNDEKCKGDAKREETNEDGGDQKKKKEDGESEPGGDADDDTKKPAANADDKENEGKDEADANATTNEKDDDEEETTPTPPNKDPPPPPLVLTGTTAKRGLYECDYCKTDVTQIPRIRCAVCPDFDLCLDCFATTDPSAANSSRAAHAVLVALEEDVKAEKAAEEEESKDGKANAAKGDAKKEKDGAASSTAGSAASAGAATTATTATGLSVAAANHDHTHGYRVADSTRFPVFATARGVVVRRRTPAPAPAASASTATTPASAAGAAATDAAKADEGEGQPKAKVARTEEKGEDAEMADASSSSAVETKNEEASADADGMKKGDDAGGEAEAMDVDGGDDDAAGKTAEAKVEEKTDKEEERVTGGTDKPKEQPATADGSASSASASASASETTELVVADDPRSVWTAEEDLRLLDAISTYGLGNWADISEAVSGGLGGDGSTHGGGGGGGSSHGGGYGPSSNKSARRCMERFCDDYLGRYGHILPPYALVEVDDDAVDDAANANNGTDGAAAAGDEAGGDEVRSVASSLDSDAAGPGAGAGGGRKRKRKESARAKGASPVPFLQLERRSSSLSVGGGGGGASGYGGTTRKKYRAVPTESLPGYSDVWPHPHLPPGMPDVTMGDPVNRDLAVRAEQDFVKASTSVSSRDEADRLRAEWLEKRLNDKEGPRVLPMRVEDIRTIPGSELAGFMPRRGDFDVEWDNDAESILADMEFSPNDLPQDRNLKIQIIEIYNSKLDERERRKKFLVDWKLLDYRKNQHDDLLLPSDERDLVHRMRLFARFHTPEEHDKFVKDLLKAKRLRKEIAQLQQYRRMGITTLADAERYELDRNRREAHKVAQRQKEAEEDRAMAAAVRAAAASSSADVKDSLGRASGSSSGAAGGGTRGESSSSSLLWKEYRSSDRRGRKSVNRGGGGGESAAAAVVSGDEAEGQQQQQQQGQQARDGTEGGPAPKKGGDDVTSKEEEPTDMEIEGKDGEGGTDAKDGAAAAAAPTDPSSGSRQAGSRTFRISDKPGFDLLSSKEVQLCTRLRLLPELYLEAKKALITESFMAGILDREGPSSSKRAIVKIDVEKRDSVIDFVLRCGWISKRPNV